jgi:anti-sigma B factor antagonist
MSLNISINYNEEKNIWHVIPEGEIDIYTSSEFRDKIVEKLKEKMSDILIDGERLDYLDSTGLGALISILKITKENENNIYLENIKPNIRKLFDITDLDKVFIIKE